MSTPRTNVSARQWQLANAGRFLAWRREKKTRESNMRSVCESISATADLLMARVDAIDVAHILPDALRRCDDLEFASLKEALAYFILHFSDRYGRADQVLEIILQS